LKKPDINFRDSVFQFMLNKRDEMFIYY